VSTVVLEGCAVVTMDQRRAEHARGHVVIDGRRIAAVGPGPAPAGLAGARHVDASGCLATPGLINTHQHLYQWATRGQAVDSTLFGWLTQLYPVWAGIDEDIAGAAAAAALAWLARTGCSTTMDHHYVFPRGGGDVLGATVEAARAVGLRFHPTRGSMDLGASAGGLPPDDVVESIDEILAATDSAIDRFHDSAPESMLRVAVAPCSPFSVSGELLTGAAELARRRGVRLHTHLAETADEDEYCAQRFGCTPVEYLDSLGWLGGDVWLAHTVHLDDAGIAALAATGTGVAHCPSSNGRLGAGICRSRDLLAAGVPVGLGVDGAASNEAGSLLGEIRQAALMARAAGGPQAMSVRQAVELATLGGARLLGREAEIGSLEPGKLADVALWRLDTLPHAGIEDPVAALVLGPPAPLELLLVNGQPVVERDAVITVDERQAAAAASRASATLLARAGAKGSAGAGVSGGSSAGSRPGAGASADVSTSAGAGTEAGSGAAR
jgi:cytosine/adenosine deaminase-related metal-dependent hydrolase